jgi:hypothetical protein
MLNLFHKTFLIFSLWLSYSLVLAVQICPDNLVFSTPTDDFSIKADLGVVVHKKTSLMWKICSEGQTYNSGTHSCTGTATTMNWATALETAKNFASAGFAGFNDWRLPNVKELRSIIEYRCYNPAINLAIFPDTSTAAYWSSSPVVADALNNYSELIDFNTGETYFGPAAQRNDPSHVIRLVRSVAPDN